MNETASYDAVVKALRMLKRIRRLEGTVLVHEGILLAADTLLSDDQNAGFVREINSLVALYRNAERGLSRILMGFDGGNVMLFHVEPFTMALFFGDLENAEAVEAAGEEFIQTWAASLKLTSGKIVPLAKLEADAFDAAEQEPEQDEVVDEASDALATQPILPMAAPSSGSKSDAASPLVETLLEEKEALAATLDADDSESSEVSAPDERATSPDAPMQESPQAKWKSFRTKMENLFGKVLGRAQAKRFIEREMKALGIDEDGYLTASQFRPFGQKLIKQVKDRSVRKQLELELISIVEEHVG